jgi:hypothetical protein
MRADLEKKLNKLHETRRELTRRIATFAPEKQLYKPDIAEWSMLEVLEHLIIAENLVIKGVKHGIAREEHRFTGLRQWINYLALKLMLLVPVKFKAPSAALFPSGRYQSLSELEALALQIENEWNTLMANFPSALYDKNIFRHPVAGVFNISQTIGFCISHIRHHHQQIERLKMKM